MYEPEISCNDAAAFLASLPGGSVDFILTSPPYDGVRDYEGFSLSLHDVGRGVLHALKPGGVCAVVIQDGTKDGHKSTTTFRTIVDWVDIGLGLFECLVWHRHGRPGNWWSRRFRVDHEYVPVFVKGKRPAHFDKEHMKVPSKGAGQLVHGTTRTTSGELIKAGDGKRTVPATKCPGTVLTWQSAKSEPKEFVRGVKFEHPATFPNALAADLVRCFCPPGGLVVDPMAGSGTTGVAAMEAGRRSILNDCAESYRDIMRRRISLRKG